MTTTPEQIEANKKRTMDRRAANTRRAKSRQLGLKNLVKEEEACSHKLKLAKGLVIVLHRENCPRCLRRRMRYYRARSRAAEGALKNRQQLTVHAREFLKTTASAGGGAVLPEFEVEEQVVQTVGAHKT